ncbi:MAG TPA: SsrA-binding protein SmpB [Candidatus Binatia bacterium]|nr:SsrA-binding protein SmpB [Candidatus Binatia bacterium]
MAKSAKGSKGSDGRIADNRKARFNYSIEETLEAGIVLTGTEVRSARDGGVNLSDSYVRIQGSEAWLLNCRIAPYPPAGKFNHEPLRERKLLLHRRQIDRLDGHSRTEGYALIITRMYFDKNGRVKAEVGLARGKKLYDKRASAREKDAKREIERAMRQRG